MQNNKDRVCEICGTNNKENKNIYYCSKANKFLCPKHRYQFDRHGTFLEYTIYDRNKIITHENFAEIELKNKYGKVVGYAIIDIDDLEKCKEHKWHINKGYIEAKIDGKKVYLHKYLLGHCDNKKEVDHINRNKLDNRRENLRMVSKSENLANRNQYGNNISKCIRKRYVNGLYEVHIIRNRKTVFFNKYKTLEEAIKARDDFITEYNYIHNRAC